MNDDDNLPPTATTERRRSRTSDGGVGTAGGSGRRLLLVLLGVVSLLAAVGGAAAAGASGGVGDKLFFKDDTQPGGGGGAGEVETVRGSVGQSVVLECEAGGSPSPTVHWLRNGKRVHQGYSDVWADDEAEFETSENSIASAMSLKLSLTRSRLFIDCLSPSTAGEYVCVAETPTRRITREFLVEIDDVVPNDARTVGCLKRNAAAKGARVYMWTSHRIELENADVQLFCRVDGNPKPEVTWYDRDGVAIVGDSPQYKILASGDLLVRKVTWTNNMGLYECVARNQQGSDAVHTFLYPTKAK